MSNETLTFTIDKKKIKADHQYADELRVRYFKAYYPKWKVANQLKALTGKRFEVVYSK